MPRRPPDALVYYLDANLDGPELVKRLRAAGMPCEPHRDHFAPDAEDEAWIPAIAARGWIIRDGDFAEGLERVAMWNAAFLPSEDLGEAASAFAARRPPVRKGR